MQWRPRHSHPCKGLAAAPEWTASTNNNPSCFADGWASNGKDAKRGAQKGAYACFEDQQYHSLIARFINSRGSALALQSLPAVTRFEHVDANRRGCRRRTWRRTGYERSQDELVRRERAHPPIHLAIHSGHRSDPPRARVGCRRHAGWPSPSESGPRSPPPRRLLVCTLSRASAVSSRPRGTDPDEFMNQETEGVYYYRTNSNTKAGPSNRYIIVHTSFT